MIVTETILGAWQELLFRLSRFGIPTTFRSGKRRNELLDVKVVIGNPGAGMLDEARVAPRQGSPAWIPWLSRE